MKRVLNRSFYQRYFLAIAQKRAMKTQAEWLSWVPQEYRLDILSRLMQWDLDEMNDEQYRQHL
ncbi:glucose uptake inhibitor SgrT [Ewingella americana]